MKWLGGCLGALYYHVNICSMKSTGKKKKRGSKAKGRWVSMSLHNISVKTTYLICLFCFATMCQSSPQLNYMHACCAL